MTELLKQAIDLSKNEQPIPVSDQLIIDWLDSLIDLKEQIIQLSETHIKCLEMGELDEKKGEYTYELRTCEFNGLFNQIQLFNGIKEIARALNKNLTIRDLEYSNGEKRKEASFEYRGYTILELL